MPSTGDRSASGRPVSSQCPRIRMATRAQNGCALSASCSRVPLSKSVRNRLSVASRLASNATTQRILPPLSASQCASPAAEPRGNRGSDQKEKHQRTDPVARRSQRPLQVMPQQRYESRFPAHARSPSTSCRSRGLWQYQRIMGGQNGHPPSLTCSCNICSSNRRPSLSNAVKGSSRIQSGQDDRRSRAKHHPGGFVLPTAASTAGSHNRPARPRPMLARARDGPRPPLRQTGHADFLPVSARD